MLAAKAEAERQVRRQSQAAETRLASELDRLRWALTEATLSGVKLAFQEMVDDREAYLGVLEQWLAARLRKHCRRATCWQKLDAKMNRC